MKNARSYFIILTLILIFLEPTASQAQQPELQCFGTEPFWVASIRKDRATFTALGEESIEIEGELITPKGVSSQYAQNFTSDTFVITTLTGNCSDGTSGTLYAKHAVIQFLGDNKQGLIGCCQPGPKEDNNANQVDAVGSEMTNMSNTLQNKNQPEPLDQTDNQTRILMELESN